MDRNLSDCQIRTSSGGSVERLYEFLSECFPPDRPVFAEMARTGKRFYTWTPHTLYRGNEIVGNISLMPMRIWLEGRVTDVVGIASVATAPQYRRQGVASHMLRYALSLLDPQHIPCVLLTGLPEVYQGVGFRAVPQECRAARASQLHFASRGFDGKLLMSLDDARLPELVRLYAEKYPNYDGKVDRDPDYWQLYVMLFNLSPKSQLLLCVRGGEMFGYARFDQDGDRLTVCELCAEPSAVDVCEALLGFLAELAAEARVQWLSFALPPDHFAWPVLRRHDVAIEPEPPGAARETFMVRPASGQLPPALLRLQWSLADKF
jgi:predicted acetyltransferase